jgi:hypothetical protein
VYAPSIALRNKLRSRAVRTAHYRRVVAKRRRIHVSTTLPLAKTLARQVSHQGNNPLRLGMKTVKEVSIVFSFIFFQNGNDNRETDMASVSLNGRHFLLQLKLTVAIRN